MDNMLADELIARLLASPEQHDQDVWIYWAGREGGSSRAGELLADCGTTACAAGWTALLTLPADTLIEDAGQGELRIPVFGMTVETYAQRRLELDPVQAGFLFNYTASTSQVVAVLKHLKDHPRAGIDELREVRDAGRRAAAACRLRRAARGHEETEGHGEDQ